MLRRAFTLIELLVVIAIIAILAAILFPVFAQAKLAAKKTQDLSNQKQLGTSLQLYLNDYDDTLPPYRTRNTPNPYAPHPNITGNSVNRVFFNQLVAPYVKNNDIWRSPGNPEAWVNTNPACTVNNDNSQDVGDGCSYGGQNSYGVNNYMFPSGASLASAVRTVGLGASQVVEVANTVLMTNARYYNVLPRYTDRQGIPIIDGWLNGDSSNLNPRDPLSYADARDYYYHYWKYINYGISFSERGVGPDQFYDNSEAAILRIENRAKGLFNNTANVVFADTHAKATNYTKLIDDLIQNPTSSMWDPYKAGVRQ
jgi:prepilin-type N-terminal cleavage/methylation domain-containing protein/prepilin-type processing-associated H-X9-DG protein